MRCTSARWRESSDSRAPPRRHDRRSRARAGVRRRGPGIRRPHRGPPDSQPCLRLRHRRPQAIRLDAQEPASTRLSAADIVRRAGSTARRSSTSSSANSFLSSSSAAMLPKSQPARSDGQAARHSAAAAAAPGRSPRPIREPISCSNSGSVGSVGSVGLRIGHPKEYRSAAHHAGGDRRRPVEERVHPCVACRPHLYITAFVDMLRRSDTVLYFAIAKNS